MSPGQANLFLDSVQVTMLDAGERINVVPPVARARIDVRLLPDTDADAFLARVREALGPAVEVEVLLAAPPSEPSPDSGPLWEVLTTVLSREAPVVPSFMPGFTDSRFFRQRGIPTYGVAPFALEPQLLSGIHGVDERIPVDEFERGVERVREIVRTYATGSGE
jgi:acetylornithine deacetylase/succinyl-diaminopimelate desuccinylase-like protein